MTNPLVAQRQDSTQAYTGIGLVESAVDLHNGIASGSWIEGGLGLVGTGLEALSLAIDPIGTMVQYLVSWLIEHLGPLRRALDWLAGDPDQIAAYARTWENVSQAVDRAKGDFDSEVNRGTAGWTGSSADAYRRSATAQAEHLTAAAWCAKTIGTVVEVVGVLVGTVRAIVRDLVAECISLLIVRLPLWAFEAGVTFGVAAPYVVGQATTLIAKWVARIGEFTIKLVRSVARLRPLLSRLDEIWDLIKKGLKALRKTPDAPTPKTPDPVKQPGSPDVKPKGGETGGTNTGGTTGGDPASKPPQVGGSPGDTPGSGTGTSGGPVSKPPEVDGSGTTSTSGTTTGGGVDTTPPPKTGGDTNTSGSGSGSGSDGSGGGGGNKPPDNNPPPTPDPNQHPALPRRPTDPATPHPELTAAEKAALDKHLRDLEGKHSEKFAETAPDPDHNGRVTRGSSDEARIALDLEERGLGPFERPKDANGNLVPGKGDFVDAKGQAWDMKGAHSDWPPDVPEHVKNGRPFPNAYSEQWFRDTVQDQFGRGRNVIMDTRNASAADIANMKQIVDREGWGGRIIWYP
jgi:hypothetical protein